MKKTNQIIWGMILIVIGVVLGLNAFGITSITLFFDGWWTMFFIIPAIVGIVSGRDKMWNILVLCIGVFLLLCCWDILDFNILWKLLFPALIVFFGLKMIFGGHMNHKCIETKKKIWEGEGQVRYGTAVFSGENMDFTDEIFQGAELNAVFGGLKCDLRNAVINEDCVIQASAIFGGIDIFLPDHVNIKVSSTSIFGGISNKKGNKKKQDAPTVYINGTCMFGGVDIK